jgi:hypothetical protein
MADPGLKESTCASKMRDSLLCALGPGDHYAKSKLIMPISEQASDYEIRYGAGIPKITPRVAAVNTSRNGMSYQQAYTSPGR